MAHFRFTINELQNEKHPDYKNDLRMLIALVAERETTTTNVYSPLSKRLKDLRCKLEKKLEGGKKTI